MAAIPPSISTTDDGDAWARLLQGVQAGEAGARDSLFALAYNDLRRLARSRLRDGGRDMLMDTSVLLHESYLRFTCGSALHSEDRRAFFAYASQVMRSVIVDAVRERQAQRRGGDVSFCTLNTAVGEALPAGEDDVLRVHEALQHLAAVEPRLAQVVEMRYFMGSTEAEVALALDVTERTVRRDWEKARMMLAAMLE